MIGKDMGGYEFGIAVTVMDCSGCGNCAKVCPAKEKSACYEAYRFTA